MIKKLIRQMLAAQVFSALTVSLCLLIDSIMISRFLKETAIAAYGLANPLLLAIGAIGTLLAGGVQVVCSKALGRGSQEEANEGYSSAVAAAGGISLLFTIAVLLLRVPLAEMMGAGSSGDLFEKTRDYLVGFSIGAPGSMGALVLVPFLQMAGQSNLLIAAVLTMTVADVGLDLLNVLVFNGGMFGMGLASALSYYAAMAVAAIYLVSKRSVFRFSRKSVSMRMIGNLFRRGIPTGVNMLASVILVFVMNRLLTSMKGEAAVAAYTVFLSIGNAANCITTGSGGVSLTLCGIFFHEEDRSALRETVKRLCRSGVVLGAAVGALLLAAAPALISLYIPEEGEIRNMAILGLRLFAAGLIPCCINNVLKNAFLASGRETMTEILSLLEGAVFPALAAVTLSLFMNTDGAWLGFAAGEILTLGTIGILVYRRSGEAPWRNGAYLLLKDDFGAAEGQTLEISMETMEDVTAAAERAEAFCLRDGQDARLGNHIALCIEEMAGNVIQHGFREGKKHHLSVLILNKPDHWVLRFRDDCRAFDPVRYAPGAGNEALGIRLVQGIARDAYYTYSMNLNNLVLKLPKETQMPAGEE
ncbi:MAG: ATP-binding protein [Clostridiales bacterium]|nr:ATP-binding protein [Clostridiales bacterium]